MTAQQFIELAPCKLEDAVTVIPPALLHPFTVDLIALAEQAAAYAAYVNARSTGLSHKAAVRQFNAVRKHLRRKFGFYITAPIHF